MKLLDSELTQKQNTMIEVLPDTELTQIQDNLTERVSDCQQGKYPTSTWLKNTIKRKQFLEFSADEVFNRGLYLDSNMLHNADRQLKQASDYCPVTESNRQIKIFIICLTNEFHMKTVQVEQRRDLVIRIRRARLSI